MYDDCNIMWKNTGMVYVSEDDYGKLLDSRSHSTEPKIQKLWYNCLCFTILIYEIIWASFQYVCICLWVVWYMDAVLTGWHDYCLLIKIVQVHVNLCVYNKKKNTIQWINIQSIQAHGVICIKPGLHCPDCGARWSPMAKSAGFVSTSANSEGTSVNNVTLPGNILRHRQWRPNVRPTSANCPERTNMFVNFGYVGGESVYRGLSGNIGKSTQENASPSGFFPGYIGYIR